MRVEFLESYDTFDTEGVGIVGLVDTGLEFRFTVIGQKEGEHLLGRVLVAESGTLGGIEGGMVSGTKRPPWGTIPRLIALP